MTGDKRIKVELFTSNVCPKCKQAKHLLAELIAGLGEENFDLEFIDVVKNIDRSVEAGILATPSLIIDHQISSSVMPGHKELSALLKKSLEALI